VHRDANELLTGAINDVENGSMPFRRRELFNEVERDGMPWSRWNRKLLNKSEWLMARVLVSLAGDTTVNKVLNVSVDVRPSIIESEELERLILTRMACSGMIVLELENTSMEVARVRAGVWNINLVVDKKKTRVGNGITGGQRNGVDNDILSELVSLEGFEDVFMEVRRVNILEDLVDNWL
jgi:hypothetical protein